MILHFKLASISKVNFFNELAMPYISLGWQKMVTILNSPAHQIPDQGVPLQMKKKKKHLQQGQDQYSVFFFFKVSDFISGGTLCLCLIKCMLHFHIHEGLLKPNTKALVMVSLLLWLCMVCLL